jgi:Polyketide cyclase / dehydrase and lipid transport
MGRRRLAGSARATLPAPAEACFAVVRDVEAWPDWQQNVSRVEVLERGADGAPARVELELRVLAFHPSMRAAVTLDPPTALALDRTPYGPGDDESLRLTITLAADGDACTARAEVEAALDVPRLVPLPQAIGDRFAADILTALARRVPPA